MVVFRDCFVDTATLLQSKGFTHLSTITVLDLDDEIELIDHLMNEGMHLGLRTKLPLDDLVVPTLTNLIPRASMSALTAFSRSYWHSFMIVCMVSQSVSLSTLPLMPAAHRRISSGSSLSSVINSIISC